MADKVSIVKHVWVCKYDSKFMLEERKGRLR